MKRYLIIPAVALALGLASAPLAVAQPTPAPTPSQECTAALAKVDAAEEALNDAIAADDTAARSDAVALQGLLDDAEDTLAGLLADVIAGAPDTAPITAARARVAELTRQVADAVAADQLADRTDVAELRAAFDRAIAAGNIACRDTIEVTVINNIGQVQTNCDCDLRPAPRTPSRDTGGQVSRVPSGGVDTGGWPTA